MVNSPGRFVRYELMTRIWGRQGILPRVVGWNKVYLLPLEVCRRAHGIAAHPVARIL